MKEQFTIHFFSPITGEFYKKATVSSRERIRSTKDRLDNQYGAYLSMKIFNKEGVEVQTYQVPSRKGAR